MLNKPKWEDVPVCFLYLVKSKKGKWSFWSSDPYLGDSWVEYIEIRPSGISENISCV